MLGSDPQSLAELGLKDATKACEMEPGWALVRLLKVPAAPWNIWVRLGRA